MSEGMKEALERRGTFMYSGSFMDISFEFYRKIFNNNFNIKFGFPRSDTCSSCDKYTAVKTALLKNKNDSTTPENDTKILQELRKKKIEHKLHLRKAEVFYDRNYFELLDLLALEEYNMRDHLEASNIFKGTSSEIQNQLIESVECIIRQKSFKDLQEADFISVQADEKTDVSCKSQFSVILSVETSDNGVKKIALSKYPEESMLALQSLPLFKCLNPTMMPLAPTPIVAVPSKPKIGFSIDSIVGGAHQASPQHSPLHYSESSAPLSPSSDAENRLNGSPKQYTSSPQRSPPISPKPPIMVPGIPAHTLVRPNPTYDPNLVPKNGFLQPEMMHNHGQHPFALAAHFQGAALAAALSSGQHGFPGQAFAVGTARAA
ncbi:unnamed protein product [Diabrotica balteata]|uniref:Uncharacterized protein n=1 Tax=Diabrotica balteata TaxID=107213 RepID=A0A9N9X8X0_DIABA|nr:unnamed protein product [Diabrotica balteata]